MAFRKKRIFLIIICFSSFLLAEQFIKKKSKTPSVSQLKEECCERYGRIMQDLPMILHAIADLQSKAIDTITGYCEGDSASFCQKATKDELLVCNQTLSELETILSQVREKLSSQIKKL